MSLRGRLLAASLALVVIGLVLASSATYLAFRSFLLSQVTNELTQDIKTIRPELGALRSNGTVVNFYVEGISGNQQVLGPYNPYSPGPQISSNFPVSTDLNSPQPFTVSSVGGGAPYYRAIAVPVQFTTLFTAPIAGQLVLAVPLTEESRDLERLVAVEVLVGAGVLLAAAVVGSWLVRLGLRPLGEIEATADKIAAGDLTERIPIDYPHSEVGHLGNALNTMLGKIEAAFEERRRSEEALRASEERLRQFVSDASHELRTPIAAVRANAELFRRGGEAHPEDIPAVMARIEAEAARMGILVEDLLLLTRLDEGRPLEYAPVDLGALAADSVQAAKTIEPDRPIALQVEGSVEVLGDRHRLRQVIDNLLANVRTHTPAGTPASVTVRQAGDRALVEVADSGPGIDPTVGAQIFERFFRADPSRARDRGGAGLGLSIVAAITAAHGGLASATNRLEGGALFRIDLPALVEAVQPEPISELDADDLQDAEEAIPPPAAPAHTEVWRAPQTEPTPAPSLGTGPGNGHISRAGSSAEPADSPEAAGESGTDTQRESERHS